jgi:hypothetical protein
MSKYDLGEKNKLRLLSPTIDYHKFDPGCTNIKIPAKESILYFKPIRIFLCIIFPSNDEGEFLN